MKKTDRPQTQTVPFSLQGSEVESNRPGTFDDESEAYLFTIKPWERKDVALACLSLSEASRWIAAIDAAKVRRAPVNGDEAGASMRTSRSNSMVWLPKQ